MNLKYNHDGNIIEIPFSSEQPSGKSLAVRHNDTTYYAALVDTADSAASDFRIVFDGGTYALSSGASGDEDEPVYSTEQILSFSSSSEQTAWGVTIQSHYGDLGVIADSNSDTGYNVTLANGTEYFTGIHSITANQNSTSVIAGANGGNTKIFLSGGKNNYIVTGMNQDSIYFNEGGGVCADFCVKANTKAGSGVSLASFTSQQETSNILAYNRFDTGSYQKSRNSLVVNGTVTGIFCDTSTVSSIKSVPTMDVFVTYTDTHSKDQVILLKDCYRSLTTAKAAVASRRWNYPPSAEVKSLKICEGTASSAGSAFASSVLSGLTHDFADFPTSLRPVVCNLYNIYYGAPFRSSRVNDGSYTQVLPDWVPTGEST